MLDRGPELKTVIAHFSLSLSIMIVGIKFEYEVEISTPLSRFIPFWLSLMIKSNTFTKVLCHASEIHCQEMFTPINKNGFNFQVDTHPWRHRPR